MIRPSWIELLVSSRMRVLAPLAVAAGVTGLNRSSASAQGTPTVTEADELLARSAAAMQDLTSYRFDLAVENGPIEIVPEVFSIHALDGAVERPASFHAHADLEVLFVDIDLEIVTINDTTWITNPLVLVGSDNELVRVGDLEMSDGFNPAAAVNPDRIALPLLGVIEEAVSLGASVIDGIETTGIEGVITRAGLESLGERFGDAVISAAVADSMTLLPVMLWIDSDDRVRQFDIRGKLFDQEDTQIVRRFSFRDFDLPISIDRPE